MSIYVTSTETPLFWTTLEERRTYESLAWLSMSWPGELLEPAHQFGCQDPYGKPAWCDCNNLTRADACDRWGCGPDCTHPEVGAARCDCDGTGCTWCLF